MMYYDNNGNNTEAERPLIEIQSTASSDKGEGSVTCVLVFSIFVAVCGSFACGLGVSLFTFTLYQQRLA